MALNNCTGCIKKDCKKRDNNKPGMCFGWTPSPDKQICTYFSPECEGSSKDNCGYWNGVCKCPQEDMIIATVVNKVIDIYMKEDYEYVVSLVKKGHKIVRDDSVESEIEFIKRNKLAEGLSDSAIETIAKLSLERINQIDEEVKNKYRCGYSL